MRIRRPLAVSAVAAVLFFLPGCTLGPVKGLSVGDARLGLQGATLVVPVNVTCQRGWNIAFGDLSVAQSTDLKLAQGFGFFENDFPGVPCTGSVQTVTVNVFDNSPWAFRRGTAAATADVSVYNPTTGELITKVNEPQAIDIRNTDPQPNPVRAARPARDARYSGG